MSDGSSFLEELKRRKVVRVAVVYLAVVWAVVQVADVFVPALGLSEKLVTAVAVLAILGLPVALALAWAFDVTPDGLKRTGERSGVGATAEPGAPSAGAPGTPHWMGAGTVAVAAVLIAGGYLAGRFSGEGNVQAAGLDPMAVAVLPFEARGADDTEGFVTGVHDDILTQLSRIDALRVTSRTSVATYRGTTKNVREIAAELGVGTVLEGGVQRTADRVRINMQLIDGATDEHLWAETYDRELTAENIFAIQSEIARAVADALELTLTADDEADLADVPTRDLEALDLYHRARILYEALSTESQGAAIALLERAVERDPMFVQAWRHLTESRSFAIRGGESSDTLPAHNAMMRTLELAPGSAEAALATGQYKYYARGDFEGALSAFRQAAAAQSGDTDVMFAMANVLRRLDRMDEATSLFEEIVRLDPRNARRVYELGWQYQILRRYDDATAAYARYEALAPDPADVMPELVEVALAHADTAGARRILDAWEGRGRPEFVAVYRQLLAYLLRDPAVLSAPRPAPWGWTPSFSDYFLYPDGSLDQWRARVAWVLGDKARARALSRGVEAAMVATTPALQPESNVIPPGQDVFGLRASQLMFRAWERAFDGRPAEARQLADQAIALYPVTKDAMDATWLLEQRPNLRIVTGDLDGAMADLEELFTQHGRLSRGLLRLDPIYDPLRGRHDFQALLAGAK